MDFPAVSHKVGCRYLAIPRSQSYTAVRVFRVVFAPRIGTTGVVGVPSFWGAQSADQETMLDALDMRDIQDKGDWGASSAGVVLRAIEEARATVRVWIETEIGVGQIAFHEGKVVVAEVGPLRKRSALLRILGMSEGLYSVERASVPPGPSIVPSVDSAIQSLADRQDEWRLLCESTPPMSSVLRRTALGKKAKKDAVGTERLVYLLVDGRRSLMDILGESASDPIDVLKAVVRGIKAGYFEEVGTNRRPTPSLLPLSCEDMSGEIPKLPSSPQVPRFRTTIRDDHQFAAQLGRMRKETLAGLGVNHTSSTPPPWSERTVASTRTVPVEVQPIIPIENGGEDRTVAEPIAPDPLDSEAEPPVSEPADSLIGNHKPQTHGGTAETKTGALLVGRYEVIHRIGRGGMGSVYLARLSAEGGFRRLVALKLLRSYLARDGGATEAFLAEARLAGQLHHPNVVGVLDAGVHQGQPYLVMDYVEGCSLKQLMTAHPANRPPKLIVPIILSALDGLTAVHALRSDDGTALNVVHCDVSPENLLIGVDGMCRLTDFGVARRGQRDGAQRIHGKPGYVAPEQVTGGPIDGRVDIFALGVVLWSALTGQRLFRGATVEETLQKVCSQSIPAPSTVGLHPPAVFDRVCLKALERDPDRRYASAEAMQAELRSAAIHQGLVGLYSEVASWVRETVGPELSQRRLLVLESANLQDTDREHSSKSGDHQGLEESGSMPPSPTTGDGSELGDDTIPLAIQTHKGRGTWIALIVSAVLAAAMVLVAILWPSVLLRLFKMEDEAAPNTVENEGISVQLSNTGRDGLSRKMILPTALPAPTQSPELVPQVQPHPTLEH